jgi:hypothetical protein
MRDRWKVWLALLAGWTALVVVFAASNSLTQV